MSKKPLSIVQWALADATETRLGGNNKIEPSDNLKENGSLDGALSLNHFNFLINTLGLWSEFNNDLIEISNGLGVKLSKDGHFCLIFAFDKINLDNYILGFADKPNSAAATTKVIINNVLEFGVPESNGNIPILNGLIANIRSFSINLSIG